MVPGLSVTIGHQVNESKRLTAVSAQKLAGFLGASQRPRASLQSFGRQSTRYAKIVRRMKALSVKQPWACAIINNGKNIENRTKCTKLRGRVAIHASLQRSHKLKSPLVRISPRQKKNGCAEQSSGLLILLIALRSTAQKWFKGPFGYVLANPRSLLKPVRCKGALGFWEIPPNILRGCRV
jgi:hypothetical protein